MLPKPAGRTRKKPRKKQDLYKKLLSVAGGTCMVWFYESTGASTALHEIVGHGHLGLRLTTDYPPGEGPTYSINGFERYKSIGKAGSGWARARAFFSWIFNSDGSGYTRSSHGKPNALGARLGPEGNDAWTSIAGSIPGLIVNSALVTAGMFLTKKHRNLGAALTVMGIVNNSLDCSYSWSAVPMSNLQLHEAADNGHDFANFALQMSHTTGLSAHAIAICTALSWTLLVPLIALGIYLYQQSHETDIISNGKALRHWLGQLDTNKKQQTLFNKLLEEYSEKEQLIAKAYHPLVLENFFYYLIENLPAKVLKDSKKTLLKEWQTVQSSSKLEKALNYAGFATLFLCVLTQIMDLLAKTIVKSLLTTVLVFKVILPLLALLTIIRAAYEVYKDWNSPKEQIPQLALLLSIVKLLVSISMVSLMMIATFVPGMQLLSIPVIVIGSLLTLGFGFAKMKVLQKNYQAAELDKKAAEAESTKAEAKSSQIAQQIPRPQDYGRFFSLRLTEYDEVNELTPLLSPV